MSNFEISLLVSISSVKLNQGQIIMSCKMKLGKVKIAANTMQFKVNDIWNNHPILNFDIAMLSMDYG